MAPDLKTPGAFVDADHVRSNTFVRGIEVHDRLGSTNDRAAELAQDANLELPALVIARLQTAGKGRGGNQWWSAEGGLTFSLLIDGASTGASSENWPQLSLATAVAVCDALAIELNEQSTPTNFRLDRGRSSAGIKWPNDVLVDGGKVCGILLQSPGGAAPAKNRLIIGIGINVNNSWRNAPQGAGAHGTALCDITGRQHQLQQVLTNLLNALATRVEQLRRGGPRLARAWQALDLLAGQMVSIESDGQKIDGEACGIADDGALLVDAMFRRRRFYTGTVRVTS
jgi:BirA family biotin operon repressor/biotin-[acetyl-CoA-carboxylase] ligase